MNNRSPFIPNIPTPQGGGGQWADPSLSQLFNVNILNNASSQHQQLHHSSSSQGQGQQQQPLYNVGFLNPAPGGGGGGVPSSTSFFSSDAWAAGAAALTSSLPSINSSYSYQLAAAGGQAPQVNYSSQGQGQLGQFVMHNIVTNQQSQAQSQSSSRGGGGSGLQLTLDNPHHHFAHFPVNLSPPAPAPIQRSRSPQPPQQQQFNNNSQPQRNSSSSRSHSQQQQQQFSGGGGGGDSPCSSPGLGDSRGGGLSMDSLSPQQQYQVSNMMLNSASYLSSLPFLNLANNSRLQSPSSSMSPYSGGSVGSPPSPTPTHQHHQQHQQEQHHVIQHHGNQSGNMRGSGGGERSFSSHTPAPSPSPAPSGRRTNPPPSPAPHHQQNQGGHQGQSLPGVGQFFTTRSPPLQHHHSSHLQQVHVQTAPPPAHMLSRPSPSPGAGAYVPPPPPSPSPNQNNSNSRIPGYHQLLHPASSLPHPARTTPPRAPSPPPPPVVAPPPAKPPRKPRAPRKKKEPPMKPIPINLQPPPPQPHPLHPHPISAGQAQLQGQMIGHPLSMPNLSNSWTPSLPLPPRPSYGPPGGHFQSQPHPLPPLTRPTYQTLTNVRTSQPQQSSVIRSTSSVIQQPPNNTPLTVTASPQRAPQRRGSKGAAATATPTTTPATSPNKAALSMLDYAMEKAGIPSTIIQIHGQGLGPGNGQTTGQGPGQCLSDAELLGLVGETDSAAPPPTAGTTPQATKVPGDFDLESELNRFYSPPSPKESKPAVTISVTAAPPPAIGSKVNPPSTPTKVTGPPPSSQSSKTGPPPATNKGGVKGATGRKPTFSDDDDDDCEVILVKLGEKRPGGNRGRRPPPPRGRGGVAVRGGVSVRGGPPRPVPNQGQRGSHPGSRGVAPPPPGRRVAPDPRGVGGKGSMVRSAYPNGRVVTLAPKTTVPIPPKTTARKSTAPPPPAPPPSKRERPPPRPRKRASSPEDYWGDLGEEIAPKMTRQAAKALLEKQLKEVQKLEAKEKKATAAATPPPPPIRMKLNLKEGTAHNVHNQTKTQPPPRAGPKSRTRPGSSGGGEKVKSPSEVGVGDDDLLIVDEFLADSDDSYDPDGERDEASSESEGDSDHKDIPYSPSPPSSSGGGGGRNKKKSPGGKAKRLKIDDEEEDEKDKKRALSPSGSGGKGVSDDEGEVAGGICSPLPFDNDSPLGSVGSPPSPPFKNHVGEPEVVGDGPEVLPLWRHDPDALPEKPPVLQVPSEGESEEEEAEITLQLLPPKFQAPKPTVVLKGTKEEADKALNTMRAQMAQLTKFKLPFFGSK